MSKVITGTLIGTIIVFVYQSLSWMVLPVHKNSFKYTPAQDSVLSSITKNLSEDGRYMLPNLPPNASEEDHQKMWDTMQGKPNAIVSYWKSTEIDMLKPIVIGFILNLISVWVIAIGLSKSVTLLRSFGARFTAAATYGVVVTCQATLMDWNWMHTHSHYLSGMLIDNVVITLLLSSWLAWWFGREK